MNTDAEIKIWDDFHRMMEEAQHQRYNALKYSHENHRKDKAKESDNA